MTPRPPVPSQRRTIGPRLGMITEVERQKGVKRPDGKTAGGRVDRRLIRAFPRKRLPMRPGGRPRGAQAAPSTEAVSGSHCNGAQTLGWCAPAEGLLQGVRSTRRQSHRGAFNCTRTGPCLWRNYWAGARSSSSPPEISSRTGSDSRNADWGIDRGSHLPVLTNNRCTAFAEHPHRRRRYLMHLTRSYGARAPTVPRPSINRHARPDPCPIRHRPQDDLTRGQSLRLVQGPLETPRDGGGMKTANSLEARRRLSGKIVGDARRWHHTAARVAVPRRS